MTEQNKNSESSARPEKAPKSVLESDHPVFGKIRRELHSGFQRGEKKHPIFEYIISLNHEFDIVTAAFISVVAIILSFFIYRQITAPNLDYRIGDIAQRHLIAQKTIEMVDDETTDSKRKTAVDAVLVVYDYDRRIFFQTTDRIRKAFQIVRKDHSAVVTLAKKRGVQTSDLERSEIFINAKKSFSNALDVELSDAQFESLVRLDFSHKVERILIHLLSKVNLSLIVSNKELLATEQGRGIALNRINDGNEAATEQVYNNISNIIDVENARAVIAAEAKSFLTGSISVHAGNILQIAKKLVVPNLTLNKQETEKRKKDVLREIKPVIVKINKGESIVKYGETINKRHLTMLGQLEKSWHNDNSGAQFLFTAIFLFIVMYSMAVFVKGGFKPYKYNLRDLIVFVALMVSSILAIKGIQFIAAEALIDKFPQVPFDFYYFMVPVAFGPVIIRMITVKEPSLIYALVLAVIGGILLDRNFFYTCYIFSSSLIATALATKVKTRGVIYRAGLITGITNVVMITCIVANTRNAANLSMLWNDMNWIFWAGMLSGLLMSFLVVALAPLVEIVTGHTTDLRLLELANMNHPLLRDLMVKAPGTYHHSIVIGSLVESAAEAIGANPLLARVMAYYHDVGKMERPLYFIENQAGGHNRHDGLQPHMSAMIIRDHVKKGQELGSKHKLPQPIIDAMSEHHGSSTIWYFYNKAKSQAEDPEIVLESDYQYDGQKPQSKETALVMLGDVVEAATRSIADPSPLRLSGVVKNILNKYFAEGQLSECDLTLRDLDTIAKSFMDVLLGIYHARIEYGVPSLRDNVKKKYAGSDTKGNSRSGAGEGASSSSGVTPISKAYQIPNSSGGGSKKS